MGSPTPAWIALVLSLQWRLSQRSRRQVQTALVKFEPWRCLVGGSLGCTFLFSPFHFLLSFGDFFLLVRLPFSPASLQRLVLDSTDAHEAAVRRLQQPSSPVDTTSETSLTNYRFRVLPSSLQGPLQCPIDLHSESTAFTTAIFPQVG